ncbi:50S ribosomal protein L17 [bacterium]|jgi:large subunit ribosomal protein L17|nr:50S ribosomal protein L17 [bacterium]
MTHGKKLRKLNVYSAQRASLIRNMTVSLLREESVTTTEARAKEIKREAEKVITLCKDESLATRRLAFAKLRDEEVLKKLYGPLRDRFLERNGGYVRLFRVGYRRGDGSPLCMLKLV